MVTFSLGSELDVDALAADFRRTGRLQIVDFLTRECAAELLGELQDSDAWRLTANKADQVIDLRPKVLAKFWPAEWEKLNKAVHLGGRYGFQFLYEAVRLGGREDAAVPWLTDFGHFMSSPVMIEFMNRLLGTEDVVFADAHASRYSAGHFLTSHDDHSPSMGRRAAYVLNLSQEWRVDWGGLLLFHDRQGNISQGFTPSFNTLSLFAVPQQHSVSLVTPLAPQPRYAVTGWFRCDQPDRTEKQV